MTCSNSCRCNQSVIKQYKQNVKRSRSVTVGKQGQDLRVPVGQNAKRSLPETNFETLMTSGGTSISLRSVLLVLGRLKVREWKE